MNDAPGDKGEIGAPVEAVEHVDDRQAIEGRLRVRAQFDGAGPAPTFVHEDIPQPPRGELADRRPAVDVIDRLQSDVQGEVEMRA